MAIQAARTDVRRPNRWPARVLEVIETVVLTAVIFFVIQTFVAQPFEVMQQSMERTLEPGQYVLVDKLTPRWDAYKRFDIVVFEPPPNSVDATGSPFIKRVIGVGGDEIEIRDGLVYVNGTSLDEPYLVGVDGTLQTTTATVGQTRWLVPRGDIFVMGDHRLQSVDSRAFGPVSVEAVVGRAWLRYWPLESAGVLAPVP